MKDHDRRILKVLQQDNRLSIDAIAAATGLSSAAVQRHVKRLRASKVIEQDVSILSQAKVELPLTIVVHVFLERERIDLLETFKREMRKAREVQQCYYVTGTMDFILVVVARNMAEFERFTRRTLFADPNVKRFESNIVMDRVKASLSLPI
jgi:Lrp/AsnC family leucine-responsive transcriptional regulator